MNTVTVLFTSDDGLDMDCAPLCPLPLVLRELRRNGWVKDHEEGPTVVFFRKDLTPGQLHLFVEEPNR